MLALCLVLSLTDSMAATLVVFKRLLAEARGRQICQEGSGAGACPGYDGKTEWSLTHTLSVETTL